MGPEAERVAVPAVIARLAGGRPARLVWRNELGGLTFALSGPARARFVKFAPAGSGLDLAAEARRLAWARPFTPVPEVLALGGNEEGSWLVTAAVDGQSAVSTRWQGEPHRAVRAIGTGLRRLHDALPVASCPFSWRVEDRMATARARHVASALDPTRWHEEFAALLPDEALERLAVPPPIDRLVVCHGDACAPNTLLDADGHFLAHVDLGNLGVADRWADLAVAGWSTSWNYGPGFEDELLFAYGVAPDPLRSAYYRLLWDLAS